MKHDATRDDTQTSGDAAGTPVPATTARSSKRPMVPPRIERVGPVSEVTTQFVGTFSA